MDRDPEAQRDGSEEPHENVSAFQSFWGRFGLSDASAEAHESPNAPPSLLGGVSNHHLDVNLPYHTENTIDNEPDSNPLSGPPHHLAAAAPTLSSPRPRGHGSLSSDSLERPGLFAPIPHSDTPDGENLGQALSSVILQAPSHNVSETSLPNLPRWARWTPPSPRNRSPPPIIVTSRPAPEEWSPSLFGPRSVTPLPGDLPSSPRNYSETLPRLLSPPIGSAGGTTPLNSSGMPMGSSSGNDENANLSEYDDPTSQIWAVYNAEAAPFDKALVESWTKDMEGILIFSGLFSAVVSAFLVDNYKNLSPDPGDVAIALLTQISLQLASNGSYAQSISPTKPFHPSRSAILVNALWFTSLILGLLCALGAILIQQWTRAYQQAIDHRPAPLKKALIRSFLFEGMEAFKMTTVVNTIPTLLHVAVVLFIMGLVQFLFSTNLIIAGVILGIFLLSGLVYLCATILPIIWVHCPYRTPFSAPLQYVAVLMHRTVHSLTWSIKRYTLRGSTGVRQTMTGVEESALEFVAGDKWTTFREKSASDLTTVDARERVDRSLQWTLASLTTDGELEPFVAGLPGVLSMSSDKTQSCIVSNALMALSHDSKHELIERIVRLLNSCIPPTTLSDGARYKRVTTCIQAIRAICDRAETLSDDPMNMEQTQTHRTSLHSFFQRLLRAGFFASLNTLRSDANWNLASPTQDLARAFVTIIESAANKDYRCHAPLAGVLYDLDHFEPLQLYINGKYKHWPWTDSLSYQLANYSRDGSQSSVVKQRYMEKCLKYIYSRAASTPAFDFVGSLITSLVKLRSDGQDSIAQLANCASARLAVHFQCNFLDSPFPIHFAIELQDFWTLRMGRDISNEAIISDVSLGMRLTEFTEDMVRLNAWLLQYSTLSEIDVHSPKKDKERLEKFAVVNTSGVAVETGYRGRILINRGRTAILIAFLHSMKRFPPPDDTLELTLDALQVITKNLTARYSSGSTQTLLVRLVDRTASNLRDHFLVQFINQASSRLNGHLTTEARQSTSGNSAGRRYILPMLKSLLDVVGTIAHPDSIVDARKAVEKVRDIYPADKFPSIHPHAVRILTKLIQKDSYAFDDSRLLPYGRITRNL